MSDIPLSVSTHLPLARFTWVAEPLESSTHYLTPPPNIANVSQSATRPNSFFEYPETDCQERQKGNDLLPSTAEFYGLPLSTKRNFSENKVSYALRIKMLYPNLSMSNTAKIVGVRACELWHLPVFNELTESGAAAQWLMPREPDESDHEYVSRLRSIFPAPELTVKDLCRLSGVQERRMRTMPEFLTLSSSAQAAIDAIKKSSDESSRDYAVRLTKNFSGLRKRDLSCISGLSLRELRNTPELRELSPTAQAARMACPKTDDENMSAYARRIKLAHPHLTILECSSLSGTDPYNLRRMKVFIGMSDNAVKAGMEVPRVPGECDAYFARRVKASHPKLTSSECAAIVGCSENTFSHYAEFNIMLEAALDVRQTAATNPSESFNSQLNQALLLEVYRDDCSVSDILPPSSKKIKL
jgi:hypothetical protein